MSSNKRHIESILEDKEGLMLLGLLEVLYKEYKNLEQRVLLYDNPPTEAEKERVKSKYSRVKAELDDLINEIHTRYEVVLKEEAYYIGAVELIKEIKEEQARRRLKKD